jgi:hypothetical protein
MMRAAVMLHGLSANATRMLRAGWLTRGIDVNPSALKQALSNKLMTMVRFLPDLHDRRTVHHTAGGCSFWRPGDLGETHGFASRPRDRFAFVDEMSNWRVLKLIRKRKVKKVKGSER